MLWLQTKLKINFIILHEPLADAQMFNELSGEDTRYILRKELQAPKGDIVQS